MYYCVIDIRPSSLTYVDIRASSLVEVQYLKGLHDQVEKIKAYFSDNVEKLLKVLEQVGFGFIRMYICIYVVLSFLSVLLAALSPIHRIINEPPRLRGFHGPSTSPSSSVVGSPH